jgi:hypothetical protein
VLCTALGEEDDFILKYHYVASQEENLMAAKSTLSIQDKTKSQEKQNDSITEPFILTCVVVAF